MAIYNAAYSVHPTTTPYEVDIITFDLGGVDPKQYPVHAKVVSRSGNDIYFDFTYPGQLPPSTDIVPEGDNTFVVFGRQVWEMAPTAQVPLNFVVVSAAETPYSVMVYI